MSTSSPLHIHEQLLLLALSDEKGQLISGAIPSYAIAAGVLAELVLEGRLRTIKEGEELELVDATPLGDALLDESLASFRSGDDRTSKKLLTQVAHTKELWHRAAQGLCDRGILKSDTKSVLLFFERRIYPELDPRPERELVERLRKVVLHGHELDPASAIVLSIAHRTGLEPAVFNKEERKTHKARIETLVEGEAIGKLAKEVVEAVQAAAFLTTVIIPAVVIPTIT